jgi:hypothetical protein
MEFHIEERRGYHLVMFRPQDLQEALAYPGAMLGMFIPTDDPVNFETLGQFLNQCLQRIGKQKT